MQPKFDFSDFEGSFRDLAEEIFQRGFRAGSENMRIRILRAAGGDDAIEGQPAGSAERKASQVFDTQAEALEHVRSESEQGNRARAPHGAVADAVQSVLSDRPGLLLNEAMDLATQKDARITRSSVGTELRRYQTDRYDRDADGRWFLRGTMPEQEPAEPSLEMTPAGHFAEEGR